MRITCTVRGEMVQMAARASRRDPAAEKLRLLAAAAIRVRQAFARNFADSGRPTWAPLAPSTLKQKMALYMAGTIRGRNVRAHLVPLRQSQPQAPGSIFALIRTGALRNSVVRSGTSGNISRIDPAAGEVTLGTSVAYAGYHESGTAKMPARPFLTVADADWDEILAMMADMVLNPDAYAPAEAA